MINDKQREKLAELVRTARGNESQSKFATRAGLSDRLIGSIENQENDSFPRPSSIARIALAGGYEPEEWFQILGIEIKKVRINTLRDAVSKNSQVTRHDLISLKTELVTYVDQRFDKLAEPLRELRIRIDEQSNIFTKLLNEARRLS